jgi:hypothetical protein
MKKTIKTVIEKKQTAKRWRENNKEYLKKWKREWYEKNCMNNPKYKTHRKKYAKENLVRMRIRDRLKYNTDPIFRMRKILRAQVTYSIKRGFNLGQKCKPTLKLLDIPSIEWFWKYIQSKFKPGMTVENQGKWHIDHIIPCASFDLRCPVQQLACFHYSNLQPLWAEDNLKKRDKLNYEKTN